MFDLKDLMSRLNLPQDITRRGFLQVATVTAAFAAMNQARADRRSALHHFGNTQGLNRRRSLSLRRLPALRNGLYRI